MLYNILHSYTYWHTIAALAYSTTHKAVSYLFIFLRSCPRIVFRGHPESSNAVARLMLKHWRLIFNTDHPLTDSGNFSKVDNFSQKKYCLLFPCPAKEQEIEVFDKAYRGVETTVHSFVAFFESGRLRKSGIPSSGIISLHYCEHNSSSSGYLGI